MDTTTQKKAVRLEDKVSEAERTLAEAKRRSPGEDR
jgi:hypothetical protein